jgi:ribosome biogenesis SPOUT family RNA methylase Rps3
MRYVIEHLEPRLYPWCLLEYRHISSIVGKKNLIFTNTKAGALKALGRVHANSVRSMQLSNACVLDPNAELLLSPRDTFDYLIIGGILGDEPMQGRTEIELTNTLNLPARNLGKEQMSTDTAVYVAKYLLEGGRFSDLNFGDTIEIELCDSESVVLPFRYVLIDGKPLLPDGLIDLLRRRRRF